MNAGLIESPETLDWVMTHRRSGGVPVVAGTETPSAGATALFALTLLERGEPRLADPSLDWLVANQRADGAWTEPDGRTRATLDSGVALEALATALPLRPALGRALHRGAAHLASAIETSGHLPLPENPESWSLGSRGRLEPTLLVRALVGLDAAGRAADRDDWCRLAREARDYYLRLPDICHFDRPHRPAQAFCFTVEGLWRLDEGELARRALASLGRYQSEEGELPAFADVGWTCAAGLAQATHLWALTGERARARLGLAALVRHADPDGGIPARFGASRDGSSDERSLTAGIHRLRAETALRRAESAAVVIGEEQTTAMPAPLAEPRDIARETEVLPPGPGLTRILDGTRPDQSVLEWGAGLGADSARLARARREVTLVEEDEETLARAREVFARLDLPGGFLHHPDAAPLPFADGHFDCTWFRNRLVHVDDDHLAHFLAEARRVTRGLVLSVAPNGASLPYRLGIWDAARRRAPHPPVPPRRHTLREAFAAAGLRDVVEESIDAEGALDFLDGAALLPLRNFISSYFASLSKDEREALGQGRLLVTQGKTPH